MSETGRDFEFGCQAPMIEGLKRELVGGSAHKVRRRCTSSESYPK